MDRRAGKHHDTGIDGTHPDLSPRITGDTPNTLIDLVGHGTHVAGIIGSSGANGPDGNNVRGSTNGASFRGKAPAARIHVLPIDEVIGPIGTVIFMRGRRSRTHYLEQQLGLSGRIRLFDCLGDVGCIGA